MRTKLLQVLLIASPLYLANCASILCGTKQTVQITSQPPGAAVKINGTDSGVTPTKAELSRRDTHRVGMTLAGYKPKETVVEPGFNPVVLGNILIGGLVGLIVDGCTGAWCKLNPGKVEAVLEKQ
jgi:PEGA domain